MKTVIADGTSAQLLVSLDAQKHNKFHVSVLAENADFFLANKNDRTGKGLTVALDKSKKHISIRCSNIPSCKTKTSEVS
jgi:hypothetical protein